MARQVRSPTDPQAKRRRLVRVLALGCGALVLLVAIAALVVYVKATGKSALPPEVRQRAAAAAATSAPSASPGSAPGTPAAAAQQVAPGAPAATPPLRQQIQQVETASRAGLRVPAVLFVNDVELNQWISSALPSGGDVRSASAYFGSGDIYITAVAVWQGREWNLTVKARPSLDNGAMRLTVQEVKVGTLTAPAEVAARIQTELDKNRDKLSPARTGLWMESITVTPGLATIKGTTCPKQ